jgi:hypothetical protein
MSSVLVAREDKEVGLVIPNALILSDRQADDFDAVFPSALAKKVEPVFAFAKFLADLPPARISSKSVQNGKMAPNPLRERH